MSGIGDQGVRPEGVVSPGDPDARERIAEHLEERRDGEQPPQDVPPGGAGADSGAADAVGVDPGSESSVPDESVHNDEAGVGTRRPDERDESAR
jgi:hypothetical protein